MSCVPGGMSAGMRYITMVPAWSDAPTAAVEKLKDVQFALDARGKDIRAVVKRELPGIGFRLHVPGEFGDIKSSTPIADIPEGVDVSVYKQTLRDRAYQCGLRLKRGATLKPSAKNANSQFVIGICATLHDTNQAAKRIETGVDQLGDLLSPKFQFFEGN